MTATEQKLYVFTYLDTEWCLAASSLVRRRSEAVGLTFAYGCVICNVPAPSKWIPSA